MSLDAAALVTTEGTTTTTTKTVATKTVAAIPQVKQQVVRLDVDAKAKVIEGHTDLFLTVPEDASGVKLHAAENIKVQRVTVNGIEASCSIKPQQKVSVDSDKLGYKRNESLHSRGLTRLADECWAKYNTKLEQELEPNLLVEVTSSAREKSGEGGLLCVSIDYSASDGQGQSLCFGEGFCFTRSHFTPTKSWVPCLEGHLGDSGWINACYPISLEFKVDVNVTAVASGSLLSTDVDKASNQQVYKFVNEKATPVSSICFAVGPFKALAENKLTIEQPGSSDAPKVEIDYYAEDALAHKVKLTSSLVEGAFSVYQKYLHAPYPASQLFFCFLPSKCMLDEAVVGNGVVLLSSDILLEEVSILNAIDSRLILARAVASQWFGNVIRPATIEDYWMVKGLSELLTSKFASKNFGENEALYQWSRKLELVIEEQDELSPSLGDYAYGFHLAPLVERHTSNNVLKFKADLLIWMIENRVGLEPFQKVVQKIVAGAVSKDQPQPLLSAEEFFENASKTIDAGVDKKWLQGFKERWVIGRGCPHLVVAFCYNRKQHTFSVAVKQRGLKSANVSGTASIKCCGKEGSGLGMVTLVTGETDGVHRNKLFIGDQALVLEDVKCHGKLIAKKRKRNKSAADLTEVEEEQAEEKNLCGPIKWLDIHHNYEWFASFEVSQTEKMWISQLELSKNIAVQLHAISGLMSVEKPSYALVNALEACVRNKNFYHRVRSEAAIALAKTAGESTNWTGTQVLLKLYREEFFDPDTFSISSTNDKALGIADQLVSHSTSVAIGLLRDEDGHSPQEATDFLQELLKFSPHDGIAYSVDERIVYLLKGIGLLTIESKERLQTCLDRIYQFLQRDAIFNSPGMMISCACIQSICSLIIEFYRQNPDCDCDCIDHYLEITKNYASKHFFHRVRIVANVCTVLLESIRNGSKRAMQYLIDMFEEEASSKVKLEVVANTRNALVLYRKSTHEPLNTGDLYDSLDIILDKATPLQLSYKLFEFVQEFGKRSLSLHRTSDEILHKSLFLHFEEEELMKRPVMIEPTTEIRRVSRPSKKTVVIDPDFEPPPSPGLKSYTMESGHTFQLGQRVRGKWRNGSQWYGGSIAKIHKNGCFDIHYDDGEQETNVPIDRVIPEGGWQFTSATAQELVSDGKKSSAKQPKYEMKPSADSKSLYSKLLSEASKEKPLTEEEKKKKFVEELMRLASKILNGLRQHRAAVYFMKPVGVTSFGGETPEQKETAFQQYLKIIDGKPMDLGTVTERTRGGEYNSPLLFRDDMRQIFINNRKFNTDPESIVFKSGAKLSETFETKWRESGIEELWEAGEIRPLIHRVESRATTVSEGGYRSDPYKRGKVKFEDETTQKMWSLCLLVLKDVKSHPKAWPFLKPVDPVNDNAPNYLDVVKNPMDFNTITDKLASRVYEKVSEFKADMELVFTNCKLYNKMEDNIVRQAGDELEDVFKLSWENHGVETKIHSGKPVLTKEDEMMKECDRIVHFLKKHKYSQPFQRPVTAENLQNPDLWAKYQDVIKDPMDIATLGNKQRRRKYKSIYEFKDDALLIFENCFKFNFPGDPVHKAGKHLKHGFKKRWKKLEEKFGIERLKPEDEAWKRVEEIVNTIYSNDLSISFRAPVDKISVPDYYDIVEHPVDLGTMQSKVQRKEYGSPLEVKTDMNLLFANCRKYNSEGDPVRSRGEELSKVFEELWREANLESLLESTCISGEESLALTLSEGGTLLPETTLLSNDSGLTQETSRHAEVLSKEKPLEDAEAYHDVKMSEAKNEHALGSDGMDIDEKVEEGQPKSSMALPKIKLKSLPPPKVYPKDEGTSAKEVGGAEDMVKMESMGYTNEREKNDMEEKGGTLASHGEDALPEKVEPPPSFDQGSSFNSFQQQECQKMLFMLKKHKAAGAFVHPVTYETFGDPALWEKYQQVVTNPMDLITICDKLKSKSYETPFDLKKDVAQIFENCYNFNYAVDPVYVNAKELQKAFMKRWLAFEKRFLLEPQDVVTLDDVWSRVVKFVQTLSAHESYTFLKNELSKSGGIGFDVSPVIQKLETKEYTDPMQVRDELRFQFQAMLNEVEGNALFHDKGQAFNKTFQELWREEEIERKFSKCSLASPAPTKKLEEAPAPPAGVSDSPEKSPDASKPKGLTLKIKLGAKK